MQLGTFVASLTRVGLKRKPLRALTIQFPSFPPITRCYGWLKIDTEKLLRRFHHYLPQERPRDYRATGAHYAMVYEYVSDTGQHDSDVIQAHLDFFYLAGFALNHLKPDKWR